MLGFVVRRLRGRLPLASAILLTVLITTAVLTALVAFNGSVGEAGLRRALQGPDHARTAVLVTGTHDTGGRAKDDAAVRTFAGQLFGSLPSTVQSVSVSRSYGLPGPQPPGKDPDLTLLAAFDHSDVKLSSGHWPQPATGPGSPVETAVPQSELARLGLTPGALPAQVQLADRFGGGPLTVRITGVYRASDRSAPYWRLDPLGGREIQVEGFTSYGPMLVDDSVFTSGGLIQNGRNWLLTADFSAVRTAEADAMRARAVPLMTSFKVSADLQARSELPVLLGELRSSMLVTRSTLLIGALQFAVLAAAALLLVVQLMSARQESENSLLTARGASRWQLGALVATEAVLLALPAALLAPLLTPPLIRLLGSYGPLSQVTLNTSIPSVLWPVAAGCALACVALTTLPALLRRVGAAALGKAGRRQAMVAGAARSGADLALLGLAALAYRQLGGHTGGGLSTDAAGQLGIDPVLVATPTLALCAGTLLVLRILPFVARLGSRLAARGQGLSAALVGWQLARRPGRATGPVLLLVLAVSTGVLALGQHTAWSASQRDQADFATAGGLRISGSEVAALGQGGMYGSLPGGDHLIPVVRNQQALPGGRTGEFAALDAAGAVAHLPIRADLLDGRSTREVFGPLAGPVPSGTGVGFPLPGRPTRIDLDVSVRLTSHTAAAWEGPLEPPSSRPDLRLLLRDRFGVTYRVPLPALPIDGDAKVSADLAALTNAPLGSVAAPLSLAGMVVAFTETGETVTGTLTVHRIAVSDTPDGPAAEVAPPDGATWSVSSAQTNDAQGTAAMVGGPADQQRLLELGYQAGPIPAQAVQVTLTPTQTTAVPAALPALATRDYLTAVGAKVGDVIHVQLSGSTVPVRITAAVGALPVLGSTALVVDLATTERLLAADSLDPATPTEWWLPAASAQDRIPAQAAAVLRSSPGVQTVQLRDDVATGLLDDPLSAAPQSALAALAVVAAVLAAIGFAAASAASAAERAGEFAVLIALGAPRRRVARTAAAEQALLVALGTAVGLGVGALIVQLVVPLVVLTPAAQRPVPPVLVGLPLGQAVALAAATAAVPLLSAFISGRRSRNVAARLRHVEEI
ncbi:FtsX-like permease family protein [Kitasatospora sp. MAP5-34]|uniref:FtsX-like permease family protein n=1 Tax=Kitasatospora sp. MAP5-34 TaxID=3035102 RepID=UPI002473FA36|nr:FtsX-like permease family protein [Kitasatospora sp. MAP5-34]MDH6577382.1 hypothetical protein [Kitasatospora sp. MAP5-34]